MSSLGSYNAYKYNSKEVQETGMYDYGWRQYMPDLGRWNGIDQLSESYASHSPYAYVANNPIDFFDPDGREIIGSGSGWKFTGSDIDRLGSYFSGGGDYGFFSGQLNGWGGGSNSAFWSGLNGEEGGLRFNLDPVIIRGKGTASTWNFGRNYLPNAMAMMNGFIKASENWTHRVKADDMAWRLSGVRSDGPIKYVGGAGDPLGIWEVLGITASSSESSPMKLAVLPLLVVTKNGDDALKMLAAEKGALFGSSTSNNYKSTFFNVNPELKGSVVVHHAVEQQVLKRYPGVVTESEMHSLDNLRGIPKSINSDVHLSQIRKIWNKFYKEHPSPTKQQLLDQATVIDQKFGTQFTPPLK